MTRLKKAKYYIDSDIDVEHIIRKDLIQIVHNQLNQLQLKYDTFNKEDQPIDDEEYGAMLLSIKRQLFKRCKKIGTVKTGDIQLLK